MKPIDPGEPPADSGARKTTFASQQPEYNPLPALIFPDGIVASRWELTDEERAAVAAGANIDLFVWTFGRPLQPVNVAVPGVESPMDRAVAARLRMAMINYIKRDPNWDKLGPIDSWMPTVDEIVALGMKPDDEVTARRTLLHLMFKKVALQIGATAEAAEEYADGAVERAFSEDDSDRPAPPERADA